MSSMPLIDDNVELSDYNFSGGKSRYEEKHQNKRQEEKTNLGGYRFFFFHSASINIRR